jgi:hypothetical protein
MGDELKRGAAGELEETTDPVTDGADEGADPVETPDADPDADVDQVPEDEKVPERIQAKFDRRVNKLTRRAKEAEEGRSAAERERDELRAELEKARARVNDEATRQAFELGMDPEYATPEEVKTVKREKDLREWRTFLRMRRSEGYEHEGKRVGPDEVVTMLDKVQDELDDLGPQARRIRERVVEERRRDIEAGRSARKGGGQKTEVGGQRSEVGGQKSEVGGRKTEERPAAPAIGGGGGAGGRLPRDGQQAVKERLTPKKLAESGAVTMDSLQRMYEEMG